MLVVVHDGEIVDGHVEEFDGAIAPGHEQLVLVELGPGEIILGIVGVVAVTGEPSALAESPGEKEGDLHLLDLGPGGGQAQDEEPAVAHDAKIGR